MAQFFKLQLVVSTCMSLKMNAMFINQWEKERSWLNKNLCWLQNTQWQIFHAYLGEEQVQKYLQTIKNKFNNIYKPYRTSSTISTNHTEQVQQYLQTIQSKFNNIYKPYRTSSTISTNHTQQVQQYLPTIQNKFNNICKPYRTSSTISTNHKEQVQQYLQTIKNKFNNIYKP
jgi:uncharacterized protein YsxB (DUF464 family)